MFADGEGVVEIAANRAGALPAAGEAEALQLRERAREEQMLDLLRDFGFARDQAVTDLFFVMAEIDGLNGEKFGEDADDLVLQFAEGKISAAAADGDGADESAAEDERAHETGGLGTDGAQRFRSIGILAQIETLGGETGGHGGLDAEGRLAGEGERDRLGDQLGLRGGGDDERPVVG